MWATNPIITHAATVRESPKGASNFHLEPPIGESDTYNYDPSLLRSFDATNPFTQPEPHPWHEFAVWLIKRIKIAVCAIPFVGALLFLRWVLWLDLKNPFVGPIDSIIVAPVITCVVFVMSTVYGNVISDYKESEKIPAELVAYFEALMAVSVSESVARGFDHRPMCHQIELMLIPLLSTLDNSMGTDDFRQLSWDFGCAAAKYLTLARNGSGKGHGGHDHMQLEVVEHSILEIKKKWTRIHDIGRLSIVLPAYTIMDSLCVLLCGTLVCADYKYGTIPPSSIYAAIIVFSFVAFYLNLMVRSLDDPFDGPQHFHYRSYCYSKLPHLTLWEVWCFPTLVDFQCLTVDLGSNLRRLCGTDPGALKALMFAHGEKFGRTSERQLLTTEGGVV